MISQSDAVRIASNYVSELGGGLVLEPQPIAYGPYGWVFCYQSTKYLQTGSISDVLAGNAPLLIEREAGKLHTLGTAHPASFYVDNFLKFGDPYRTE